MRCKSLWGPGKVWDGERKLVGLKIYENYTFHFLFSIPFSLSCHPNWPIRSMGDQVSQLISFLWESTERSHKLTHNFGPKKNDTQLTCRSFFLSFFSPSALFFFFLYLFLGLWPSLFSFSSLMALGHFHFFFLMWHAFTIYNQYNSNRICNYML